MPRRIYKGQHIKASGTEVLRDGALAVDLSTNSLYIHDGSTPGGVLLSGGGGLPLSNGDSSIDIPVANGSVEITVDDGPLWTFDASGDLTIPRYIIGSSTIRLDNRTTGAAADIQLYSADDIILQGGNRTEDSPSSEGGDINIYGGVGRPAIGASSSSSGGDITITGGDGGYAGDYGTAAGGGFITITGGNGGFASAVNNEPASDGGSIQLLAGAGGGADGDPNLGGRGGNVTIEAGESFGDLLVGGSVEINSGAGGPSASSGQIEINIPTGGTNSARTWTFDPDGIFTLASAIQLKRYDSTTSRNTDIPVPATGMMIYLDGVGLQVFGLTQWNTVSGTDT